MSLEEAVSKIVRQAIYELLQQKGDPQDADKRKKVLVVIAEESNVEETLQLVNAISEFANPIVACCSDQPFPLLHSESVKTFESVCLIKGDRSSWMQTVSDADIVITPVLTIGTLVKIALLIDDEPASGTVVNAIMSGKDVVVCSSYTVPAGAQKLLVPANVLDTVSSHFQQLIKYGVHVANRKNVKSLVERLCTENRSSKRPLLHARHVREWIGEGETQIELLPNTLITPLAKEEAKDLGLKWSSGKSGKSKEE